MDGTSRPTSSSSTAREEERLEKVLMEEAFPDSLVVAKVIDTHSSSDSDSNETSLVSSEAQHKDSAVNQPQVSVKDSDVDIHERDDGKATVLGSGDGPRKEETDLMIGDFDKSEGEVNIAGDQCAEGAVRQGKQMSKSDSNLLESGAIPADLQDSKDEKGDSKQGSTPSGGDSESSVGSSSESGSDSDPTRSNDANNGGTDVHNQVFITIETPLFVRNHYVYLPKIKKNKEDNKETDKDDSGAGTSTVKSSDPTLEKKEDTGPPKMKRYVYSSDSESDSEAKVPSKRQKRESEGTQEDSNAVAEVELKDDNLEDKQRNGHHQKGSNETKKEEKEEEIIRRPDDDGGGGAHKEEEKQEDTLKTASTKRHLEEDEDDTSQATAKRRRHDSGSNAASTTLTDIEKSETQVVDRTEEPLSGESEARQPPEEETGASVQISPRQGRRRSFTERYYEDAPIQPPPSAAVPPATTNTAAEGASEREGIATTSDASTTSTSEPEKKAPSPLGPPWNMYDARNPESATIRGTKKERYNLRIAQAMVDNAINTVLQELGFSPGSSRRKRRRRRERERQQAAFEEAGVSSAIQSQGLSMAQRRARNTASPGCPHHRRTSDLNNGAGPSSASLPVPENEDEFERLAVSEAISQAGLSKSEEPKDSSKDKDSSA